MNTEHDHRDVIVLGGGPAGSATAIALAREGVTVALLERSDFTGPRIGEMLPPETCRFLQALGVWEPFLRDAHLASPGIVFAWTRAEPDETDFIFNPSGNGWHVDRPRFDAMLVVAAEQVGVSVVRPVRVLECNGTPDGSWRVSFIMSGQILSLSASLLVDATGRAAWPTRRLGVPRLAVDQLVGVVGYFDQTEREDNRLLLEAFSDGWFYTGNLPGGRTVSVCMTDADYVPHGRTQLHRFWEGCLRKAPLTAAALGWPRPLSDLRTVSANTARLETVHGPGWVAVGDAAASYDPLSSRGISKALESGLRAADAIAGCIKQRRNRWDDFAAWMAEDFKTYLRDYQHFYGQVTRWQHSRFWQRRVGSHLLEPSWGR